MLFYNNATVCKMIVKHGIITEKTLCNIEV